MGAPSISKDIRDYLSGAPLSLTNVFTETLPPTDKDASLKNAYAIVTYAGKNFKVHGGGVAGGAGVAFDIAYLQIQSRHTANATAKSNLIAIVNALDGLGDVTINGTVYLYVEEMSTVRPFAKEESGASIFIWECKCTARR